MVGKQGRATAATMNRPGRQSLVAMARGQMRGQQGMRRRAGVADGSGGLVRSRVGLLGSVAAFAGTVCRGVRMMGESTEGLGPLRVLP